MAAQFFNRLHRYKNLIVSGWWVPLLAVLACVALVIILRWDAPPVYESTGRMILGNKIVIPEARTGAEDANFYGTQTALMLSETVSNRAVLNLQSTTNLPISSVKLKVTVSPKTSIFNLEVDCTNAPYAEAFLNAAMVEYSKLKTDMRRKLQESTSTAIQDEITRLGRELDRGKQSLVAYQSSNSVVFLQDRGNSAADYLTYLSRQLAGYKSELELLKLLTLDENVERQQALARERMTDVKPVSTAANHLKNGDNAVALGHDTTDKTPDRNPGNLVGTEGEYLKAKQEIQLLKAQRAEWSEFLRPKHPKIVGLDEDITRKEKLLSIFRDQSQD